MSPRPRAVTARDKLRISHLHPTQLELLGDDVDLMSLHLALNHKSIKIQEAVTDVVVERTIQGASTVTVSVEDRDGYLLNSGRLSSKNDTEIDGLFFRLASVDLSDTMLDLVFEDREIAVLRTYNKPIKQALSTSRKKTTRAQFILRMIQEVKEFDIPWRIPELNKVQPIGTTAQKPDQQSKQDNRAFGIPKKNDLKVHGGDMSEEQRRNANAILDICASRVLPQKIMVMAMMCAIDESSLINHTGGDLDSVGLWQQRASQGWPASRNIEKDTNAFLDALVKEVQANPNEQYYQAIHNVQINAVPTVYAAFRTEAERIVTAYGVSSAEAADANAQWSPQDVSQGDYEFYRGVPPNRANAAWGREDSWSCIRRLADEVGWRAFFVSGKFYFMTDADLLRSSPIAVLDRTSAGVSDFRGNYNENSKVATLSFTARMSRWAAAPGTIIQLTNMGPWNGRWIVNDIRRSLFSEDGTVTLKKRSPKLPEPAASNLATGASGNWTGEAGPGYPAPASQAGKQFKIAGDLVQPVPSGYHTQIIQGVHPTAGLTGTMGNSTTDYLAVDFGGDAGAPVVACENGTIDRLSGHDPTIGPADPAGLGVHGPFGWSLYLKGDSGSTYYYTHMGKRTAYVGQKVRAGESLGTIGDYAHWGGANHVHVGVKPGPKGHPDVHDLQKSPLALGAGT